MISDLFAGYTRAGTPQSVWAYNGGVTRHAIVVYACYIRDPLYEREPAPDEIRLIVEYCAYWINAPCLIFPADEIRLLRLAIQRVQTTEQLTGWLWGCSQVGLGNVLGGL